MTARMLSEQEPYVSNDGLIYTGQRTDRLFGLDLSSGQILHDSGNPYVAQQRSNSNSAHGTARSDSSVSSKSRALVDISPVNRGFGGRNGNSNGRRQLWIGRTDYTLRAFNELTGRESLI